MEDYMDEWWEKHHNGDERMNGEFDWEEIKEFGNFLRKKLRLEQEVPKRARK